MRPTFLGKETTGGQSPTLYVTERGTYLVQGWIVTDIGILAMLNMSDGETCVEVPAPLLTHLAKDGLNGEVTNLVFPIVHVKEDGNYIIQGERVTDSEALAMMDIPDHETCVEVLKAHVVALLR
ncbi:hypothetical protein GCM10022252_51020 [Streptosporangium oxazolinicum]|uniref:Uncharacterized protein n=1 Tax=Streptosporangium oxazolinicum TaxID=909287 RepID=A0ABP8B7W3_9ACTN